MMCRCWRSGGLGVGRASMRSGSEKIRGSRLVCGVCSDLRLGRPDLTHRFSQPANNEWHSGSVPHAMVCVPFCLQALFILFFHRHFSSFYQYILALSLDSSLCCSCLFWCISPHCHSVMLAFARFLSHIGTNPHVLHTPRVYFAANILFSSLLLPLL